MTRPGPGMQLKRYSFRREERDAFLAIWREIARVRIRNGFTIPFALVDDVNCVLSWAVSHPDFANGAARYYADPERMKHSRTDYDPATGAYTNNPGRAAQRTIEDYIIGSDISWVMPEPVPEV